MRVLRALLLYGGPLSVTQLAEDTKMTPQGVRLTLNTLAGQQIVATLGQGRSMLYEADLKHPMAASLKALFADEKAHWETMLSALRENLGKFKNIEAAWYYGSVARAEDRPDSDLDIAVVVSGDLDSTVEGVRKALHSIEAAYAITCSIAGVHVSEVATMAKGNAWWQEVARDARVISGLPPDRLLKRLSRPE